MENFYEAIKSCAEKILISVKALESTDKKEDDKQIDLEKKLSCAEFLKYFPGICSLTFLRIQLRYTKTPCTKKSNLCFFKLKDIFHALTASPSQAFREKLMLFRRSNEKLDSILKSLGY